MIDLRLHATDLIGKELKPVRNSEAGDGHILLRSRKYIIDEIYPLFVRCHSDCENGYRLIECFGIGDLVQMGVLSNGRKR